jgi:hypothetical protein
MDGYCGRRYAPRFGFACHSSWRVCAQPADSFATTRLELDVGTSTLSCDHAQRLMLMTISSLSDEYCTTRRTCIDVLRNLIQDSNTTV